MDDTVYFSTAFWASLDGVFRKMLKALKVDAAFVTFVSIGWHLSNSSELFCERNINMHQGNRATACFTPTIADYIQSRVGSQMFISDAGASFSRCPCEKKRAQTNNPKPSNRTINTAIGVTIVVMTR